MKSMYSMEHRMNLDVKRLKRQWIRRSGELFASEKFFDSLHAIMKQRSEYSSFLQLSPAVCSDLMWE